MNYCAYYRQPSTETEMLSLPVLSLEPPGDPGPVCCQHHFPCKRQKVYSLVQIRKFRNTFILISIKHYYHSRNILLKVWPMFVSLKNRKKKYISDFKSDMATKGLIQQAGLVPFEGLRDTTLTFLVISSCQKTRNSGTPILSLPIILSPEELYCASLES